MNFDKHWDNFISAVNGGLEEPLEEGFTALLKKEAKKVWTPLYTKAGKAGKNKKGKSAYNVFMREHKKENPDCKNLFKDASEAWKKLDETAQKPYQEMARQENEEAGISSASSARNKSSKLNGYHMFIKEMKKDKPDMSFSEIGAAWKKLGDTQQEYKDKATAHNAAVEAESA